MQHFHDVHADVQTDEVGKLERAHRVIHAELHHGIHSFGSRHALHHRECGFVDHGHEHAIGNEAGRVVDADGLLAESFAERHGGLKGVVAGGAAADHFNQRHHGYGIEEVHADEFFRTA